jgi:hypothetical protein
VENAAQAVKATMIDHHRRFYVLLQRATPWIAIVIYAAV